MHACPFVCLSHSLCRLWQKKKSARHQPGADPPLQIADGTPWCSFRVCSPSYEPAHACPRDIFAATHKCETVTMERTVWKCANAEPPVEISLPLGCDEVGSKVPCVDKIKACDCVSETKDVTEYLPQLPYSPICPNEEQPER